MGLLVYLEVLEVQDPKVCLDPLVWTDLMALLDLKASLELQVEVQEVALVPLVFQAQREKEVSPSLEVQDSLDQREREGSQVFLDSLGSPVGLDFLVQLLDQTSLDLWETPAFLDWMENMVSKVLQVLPGHLVLEQPRETEVTQVCLDSQAHPAERESRDSLEAPDSPAALVSKESAVRLASAEVLVSKASLVTLVTLEAKVQRDYEGLLVERVSLESCCHQKSSAAPLETRVSPAKVEPLVLLENLVSLACPDVPVLMVVPVESVNLAGPERLVCRDWLVIVDLLASLDPLESKVPLVTSVVPALPVASAAVSVSASLW